MNIFYFYDCPVKSAQAQPDKMLVKMPLETAQMLCTAHRELDGDEYADKVGLYKRAYWNHPSTVWVTQSVQHWNWLYRLFCALCDEYTYRYGKIHMTDSKLRELFSTPPQFLEDNGFTPPPQCMFEEYKCEDTVQAYRQYYLGAKKGFLTYTKREKPEWIE